MLLNLDRYYLKCQPGGADPLSAGIGAIGSIFGGLIGAHSQAQTNRMNLQIARETNKANRENQEYQNQWNLEQWNRENEYNSPLAQRQRLEAAGMNPIFYGLDGNSGSTGLTSAPFMAQNGAPMSNSGQFLGQGIANAAMNYAQIKAIEAQTRKTEAETDNTELLTAITRATQGDIIEGTHYRMLVDKGNVQVTENQAKLLNEQFNKVSEEITALQKNTQLAIDRFDWEKGVKAIDQFFEGVKIAQEEKKIIRDTILGFIHAQQQDKLIGIQASVAGAQVRLYNATAENIKEKTRGEKYANDFQSYTAPLRKEDGTPTEFAQNIKLAKQIGARNLAQNEANAWNFREEEIEAISNNYEYLKAQLKTAQENAELAELQSDWWIVGEILGGANTISSTYNNFRPHGGNTFNYNYAPKNTINN